jgi:hypothetical protein
MDFSPVAGVCVIVGGGGGLFDRERMKVDGITLRGAIRSSDMVVDVGKWNQISVNQLQIQIQNYADRTRCILFLHLCLGIYL